MALKGQAKTDYQREYMRKRRLKGRLLDLTVRPSVRPNVKPNPVIATPFIELDADGNIMPEVT